MQPDAPAFLDRDEVVFHCDADLAPRLQIEPGGEVVVATHDARSGKLRKPEDVIPSIPGLDESGSPKSNPATGPIAVIGAKPGDSLCVSIESIDLDPVGFVIARPEWGVVKNSVSKQTAKMLPVEDGYVIFNSLRIPTQPMVGVLGVAPVGKRISTLELGAHGGNMDCNAVSVGSKVHLPVNVDGGLLFVGDVHALMGDSEATGTGCEIGARVHIKVDLEPGGARQWPWIETDTHIIAYAAAPTVEKAAEIAMQELVDMVQHRHGLDYAEAFMLIGLVGHVRLNQACGAPIDVSVRIEFPKDL